ncbi:MAG: hypothetical protein M3R00_10800, partial [Pseudomonadota bacterium]|nr:hypothetical protein [Pseudomonadota bacterium]
MTNRLINHLLSMPFLVVLALLGAIGLEISEYDPTTVLFTACIFCTLWAVVLLCSRRVVFAFLLSWLLLALITIISIIKFNFLRVSLSAFDVYFYLQNGGVVKFLSNYFVLTAILGSIIFIIGLVIIFLVFKNENPQRVARWKIFVMLMASLSAVYLTFPLSASGGGFNYCLVGHRTSCFFVTLQNVPDLFGKNQLQKSLDKVATDEKYRATVDSSEIKAKPDIIIV